MLTIETYWHRPDKVLVKQQMPGRGEVQVGFDGEVGWQQMPGMGYQILEGEQVEAMRGQMNMHMRLAELADDYDTVETVDETEFQGAKCYKVKMTKQAEEEGAEAEGTEAEEMFVFFDAETKLLAGMEMEQESQMGPMSVTIAFKDWKPNEETGLTLYHTMVMSQMGMNMNVNYTEMTFNDVDPKVFALPDEVKKQLESSKSEGDGTTTSPTTKPADASGGDEATGASDLTPEQRASAENMLKGLMRQEDPEQLRMIKGVIEGQIGSANAQEKPVLEYIVKRLDERIKELEASGGGAGGTGAGK
jgi:hypothetical protein